jgi:hypothetical protein
LFHLLPFAEDLAMANLELRWRRFLIAIVASLATRLVLRTFASEFIEQFFGFLVLFIVLGWHSVSKHGAGDVERRLGLPRLVAASVVGASVATLLFWASDQLWQ